jgi:hypothetical protein
LCAVDIEPAGVDLNGDALVASGKVNGFENRRAAGMVGRSASVSGASMSSMVMERNSSGV